MKKFLIIDTCGLSPVCPCFSALDTKPNPKAAGSGGDVDVRVQENYPFSQEVFPFTARVDDSPEKL